MSSKTILDEVDEFAAENKSADDLEKAKKKVNNSKGKRKICPALITAACIFAVTLIFFAGWKCFFDTSILGAWKTTYNITSTDSETKKETTRTEEYTFTFNNDSTLTFHYGGMTLNGRYSLSDGNNGKNQINISITETQQKYAFYYDVSGNVFTGRTLSLTDKDGLLINDENKTKIDCDFITENNQKYYICRFGQGEGEDKLPKYDDFKADDKLTGSWLYKSDDYKQSYYFDKDGTFEILSYDMNIKGAYMVENGKIKMHYYAINYVAGNHDVEFELNYSIKDDILSFTGADGNSNVELKKSQDKYAYMQ